MNRTIIIGRGEIGSALGKVLAAYKPEFVDTAIGLDSQYMTCDVMHVCIPFSDKFHEIVEEYKTRFINILLSNEVEGYCVASGRLRKNPLPFVMSTDVRQMR